MPSIFHADGKLVLSLTGDTHSATMQMNMKIVSFHAGQALLKSKRVLSF